MTEQTGVRPSEQTASVLPRVAAIIVNWNSEADVLECVESLQRSTYPNLEIIVVDNGSMDGSVVALRGKHRGVTVIENGANLGFGRACNVGMAHALEGGAAYFFLLNSDLKIDPPAVAVLVALSEGDRSVGIAGPVVYDYTRPDLIQQFGGFAELTRAQVRGLYEWEVDHGQLPPLQEVTFIGGGIMFIRASVAQQVGGYDPMFFLYCEEVDLGQRVLRAGYKMVVSSRARVWHKLLGSFGGKTNPTVKHNYFRGWMLVGRRYLRGVDLVVFSLQFWFNRLLRFLVGCIVNRTPEMMVPAIRGALRGLRDRRARRPAPAGFPREDTSFAA